MESRLGEAVAWLPFGHQRLCTLDNVPHTVDEALFLRRQDELIVHLDRKVTSVNLLKQELDFPSDTRRRLRSSRGKIHSTESAAGIPFRGVQMSSNYDYQPAEIIGYTSGSAS